MPEIAKGRGDTIILVGFMASGKTTLGEALADALGYRFTDLDRYIERKEGKSIAEIFAARGESAFRAAEARALDEVLADSGRGVVLALGGGTPCREGVMERLNAKGITVHLDTSVERFAERIILQGATRPLAAGKSADELTAYIAAMLEKRNPYYGKAAIRFDSTRLENEEQVADSVKRLTEIIRRKNAE